MPDVFEDDVSLYDFELPEELIAQTPAPERILSRLLVIEKNKELVHSQFKNLPYFLKKGDLLVRNTTKVIPARLKGLRGGGGKSEALLVREIGECLWECMARPTSSLKVGKEINFSEGKMVGKIEEHLGQGRVVIKFAPEEGRTFWDIVEEIGEVPLPPYIKREKDGPSEEDVSRYQTVFAREGGAVAAPTAGLHFTDELFSELQLKGIEVCDVLLHVGPGTFRPVKTEKISEHKMDVEYYEIKEETAALINTANAEGRRIIAIGTTSTRALESAANEDGKLVAGSAGTDIFIYPQYKFKIVDGLITNFHLPKSTLLMLVSALCGRDRILSAYREAVKGKYRFYSYGDAMLILP